MIQHFFAIDRWMLLEFFRSENSTNVWRSFSCQPKNCQSPRLIRLFMIMSYSIWKQIRTICKFCWWIPFRCVKFATKVFINQGLCFWKVSWFEMKLIFSSPTKLWGHWPDVWFWPPSMNIFCDYNLWFVKDKGLCLRHMSRQRPIMRLLFCLE